jgi:hypothetical protein
MPFWVAVVAILSILAIFGTPIVIVKMVIAARRGHTDLSGDDIDALRAEVAALRDELDTTRADLTLMVEDVRLAALPRGDDDDDAG